MGLKEDYIRNQGQSKALNRTGGNVMQRYDFEVMKGDETIAVTSSIEAEGSLWSRVVKLAKGYPAGHRIRVVDQSGSMVIFVGVALARQSFQIELAA